MHAGYVRRSSSREPWYPRDTEMRNERQLSIVAPDELGIVAAANGHCRDQAGMDRRQPGRSTACRGCRCCRPARCCSSQNGVTIKVDAQNGPCRHRRQIDRRTRRDGRRRRPARCCFPKVGQAPARAGRLGREAGHDDGRRSGVGARARAVDLSKLIGRARRRLAMRAGAARRSQVFTPCGSSRHLAPCRRCGPTFPRWRCDWRIPA